MAAGAVRPIVMAGRPVIFAPGGGPNTNNYGYTNPQADESDSASSAEEYEPCDPCDGRCPTVLALGVFFLSLLKMVVVAPFVLIILYVGTAVCAIIAVVSNAFSTVLALCILLFACELSEQSSQALFSSSNTLNPSHRGWYQKGLCGVCTARMQLLCTFVLGAFLTVLAISTMVIFAPFFAFFKPILDTWTAWKYGKVWYLPTMVFSEPPKQKKSATRGAKKKKVIKPFCLCEWADARTDAFNGTWGVIVEAFFLVGAIFLLLLAQVLPPCSIISGQLGSCCSKSTQPPKSSCVMCGCRGVRCRPGFEEEEDTSYYCQKCWDNFILDNPEELAWETFLEELLSVGKAAIGAELITPTECEDMEPFLIMGLPGLVLLRFVMRTCGDEDDVEEEAVQELLDVLTKAYWEQGDGEVEVWGPDGNIYVFDNSFAKAEDAWIEAKNAVEQGVSLDSDSEDDNPENESISEYAVLEAWVLYGERADSTTGGERAQDFMDAYEQLADSSKTGLNRAAAKIRSLSVLITKTETFQKRFGAILSKLSKVPAPGRSKWPCCCWK